MPKKLLRDWQDREKMLIRLYGIASKEYHRIQRAYKHAQEPSMSSLITFRTYAESWNKLLKDYESESERMGPIPRYKEHEPEPSKYYEGPTISNLEA